MNPGEHPSAEAALREPLTANERFKRSFRTWFWGSMILATLLHFSLFYCWPEMTAADIDEDITIAPIIEFTPALNRDRRVPVWIRLPIVFETR